jgi:hypothetical protein
MYGGREWDEEGREGGEKGREAGVRKVERCGEEGRSSWNSAWWRDRWAAEGVLSQTSDLTESQASKEIPG